MDAIAHRAPGAAGHFPEASGCRELLLIRAHRPVPGDEASKGAAPAGGAGRFRAHADHNIPLFGADGAKGAGRAEPVNFWHH